MDWKPDLCIYHGNCDDGFGAAWAIWRRWGNEVAYIPGVYGKPLPDATGRNVLFVDFSAKGPELEAMAKIAKSVVIVDHHKTSQDDLSPYAVQQHGGCDLNDAPDRLPELLAARAMAGMPPIIAFST